MIITLEMLDEAEVLQLDTGKCPRTFPLKRRHQGKVHTYFYKSNGKGYPSYIASRCASCKNYAADTNEWDIYKLSTKEIFYLHAK